MPKAEINQVKLRKGEELEITLPGGQIVYLDSDGVVAIDNFDSHIANFANYTTFEIDLRKALKKKAKKVEKSQQLVRV